MAENKKQSLKTSGIKNTEKSNLKTGKNNKQKHSEKPTEKSNNVVISKTKRNAFIWAFCAVLTLMVVSTTLNIVLGVKINAFNLNQNQTFLMPLGVDVSNNGSATKSVTMLSNIVGGVSYPQQVSISGANNSSQVVRAKAIVTNHLGEVFNAQIVPETGWEAGVDGYVYFNGVLNAGDVNVLTKQITLPSGFITLEGCEKNHVLTFVVESLNFDDGYAGLIWEGAPTLWAETYAFGSNS